MFLILSTLLLLSTASALSRSVVATLGSRFAHTVPDTYASFNLDFHYDGEEWPSWKGCSVLNMSLTEPNLVYLAKSLSPAVLRVGGSEGDLVFYETPSSPCPPDPNRTLFCLTMQRWAEIAAFAASTGNKVAFGLNAMAGRLNKTCPLCPWDPTNAQAFLQHVAATGTTPYAFEFGNELTPFVNVKRYAQDVLLLRSILNTIWPSATGRPKLVANDANPDPAYLQTVLEDAAGAIDVATWHLYIGYGLDPLLETHAWSSSFMDKITTTATGILGGVAASGFTGEVWVGESAFAWHSGRAGVTNTFLSAPWWLSALGKLSPTHSGFCRQTLVGGNYELVDKNKRTPNPDYYLARLWKDTMGSAPYAITTNDTDLRAYAHCSPTGGLTVAYINFSGNATANLQVQGQGLGTARSRWALASADNITVTLNGQALVYNPGSGQLPALAPVDDSGSTPLAIPPHTLGFVTFTEAAGYNC